MSVHKDERNNGQWLVIFKGKKKRGFKTKREAELYESKLKLNQDNLNASLYFDDVFNMYLEDIKKTVSYSSYSKYEQLFRDYIDSFVGHKRLSQINELYCKKFSDYVYELELSTRVKNCIFAL